MSKDQINIYPQFGQLVSSWDVDCATGNYSIPLIKTCDKNTILLFNSNNTGGNSLEYNLRDGDPFQVGSEIAVSNEVGTYGAYVIGKMSEITSDYVDIVAEVDNKTRTYRINKYKQISVSKPPAGTTIEIDLTDLEGSLQLSYLFNDIYWKPSYNMILTDGDRIKLLKLVGSIGNNTDQELKGNVTLMAGEIRKPSGSNSRALFRSESASQNIKGGIEDGTIEEYYEYNLGEKSLKGESKIDLFSLDDIKSRKYYYHITGSYDAVYWGYEFKAPQFLPSGSVYIYSSASSKPRPKLSYVGTSSVKESRENEDVVLMVGKTSQIRIETKISEKDQEITVGKEITTGKEKKKYNQKLVKIKTVITNPLSKPVNVVIKHYIGNSTVESVSPAPTRIKDGYLEWIMSVNPGKFAVDYQIVTVQ